MSTTVPVQSPRLRHATAGRLSNNPFARRTVAQLRRSSLTPTPMLSEALEAFSGPYRRRSYYRIRVADVQRQVGAHELDPEDTEGGGPSQPGEVDIAELVGREIQKQQLEQQWASSSSGSRPNGGSDAGTRGDGSSPGVAHSNGHHYEGAFGHSGMANGAERQAGEASTSGRHGVNSAPPTQALYQPSALVAGGGYAASSAMSDGASVLFRRAPLTGFSHAGSAPDGTGGGGAAVASAAGTELTPLLQRQHQAEASSAAVASASASGPLAGVPRSILILSLVSMALTSASCVFNTLLPIYMVTELKMSMRSMGMFEGFLEAFSYVVRMFSGVISDRLSSRKAAITAGFAMGAAAKLGMSFSSTVGTLFVGKAIDRLANGVQAAPRDALIGDLSPAATRSACFGFAQSMRKWGSFMGAGLAFALMKVSDNNYKAIFLLAATASALSCVAFAVFVPAHPLPARPASAPGTPVSASAPATTFNKASGASAPLLPSHSAPPSGKGGAAKRAGALAAMARIMRDVRSMGRDFWRILAVIALYGLGHINESLLEARAIEVGYGKAESTLVVALLCFSVFLCAYPLGKLDDKYGHTTTFALGMASLVAGDLVLLTSGTWPAAVFVACLFWGAHWAVVQGPMLSIVVGLAPPHLKGTAFGIFYTVMALTAMVANSVYGALWTAHGASVAFGLSAAVITLTLVALPVLLPPPARRGPDAGLMASSPA